MPVRPHLECLLLSCVHFKTIPTCTQVIEVLLISSTTKALFTREQFQVHGGITFSITFLVHDE